jgi:ankyrin repeat protein
MAVSHDDAGEQRPPKVETFAGQAHDTLREVAAQTGNSHDENARWVGVPPADAVEIISDAFYIACRNGRVNEAERLLEQGAQINFRGHCGAPGLHWAAINGHRSMVEFLVHHGADMHINDAEFNSDALGWAAEAEHMAIVEFLMSRGARLTPGRAAQLGRLDWVRSSLEIDPGLLDTVMGYGTPLHQATLWGRLPVVEFLLAQGANPNVKNCNGETALTICLKALEGKNRPSKSEDQQRIAELLRLHEAVES